MSLLNFGLSSINKAVDDEISILFVTCSNRLRLLVLTTMIQIRTILRQTLTIIISDENNNLACSRLYVTADLSFVMKAGLSRLSTDDAHFFVDLNPGNWKLFNVILALIGRFDIAS